MQACEGDPALTLQVNVEGCFAQAGEARVALSMPEGARRALVDGSWDATHDLLSQLDEVRALAARLPYFHFRTPCDALVLADPDGVRT